MISFAINHMCRPELSGSELINLASTLGCSAVEFRNDAAGGMFGGEAPAYIRQLCESRQISIPSISEVAAFDLVTPTKLEEARKLLELANACGASGINLIPANNGEVRAHSVDALTDVLSAYLPLLREAGLVGYVEPLGFETSGLRDKSVLVEAINAIDAAACLKIVHDTFHHFLAGNGPIFPEYTGLVHISGVTSLAGSVLDLKDEDRGLVGQVDRLETVSQIQALHSAGYGGAYSFEPFSPAVHAHPNLEAELCASIEFITSQMAREAA